MVDDEDELYDFFVDDDALDPSDDIYGEEPISLEEKPVGSSDSEEGSARRTKQSRLFMIFLLAVIGAGGFGFYKFYLNPHDKDLMIPVVRLNSDPLVLPKDSEPSSAQSPSNDIPESVPEERKTEISVFAEDLYEDTLETLSSSDVSHPSSTITPLPDLGSLPNFAVVDLDINEDISSAIEPETSNIVKSKTEDVSEQSDLIEEQFLSQTDTSFVSKTDMSKAPVKTIQIQNEVYIPELSAVPPYEDSDSVASDHSIHIVTPKYKPASIQNSDVSNMPVKNPLPKEAKIIANQWVIKAILPGKAVIYNEISGDTRSVEVGDRVPSVGLISSIQKISEKWVVVGSDQSITQ